MKRSIGSAIFGIALVLPLAVWAQDDEHEQHHPQGTAAQTQSETQERGGGDMRQMEGRMQKMQDIMQRMRSATDAKERQRLMKEHMQAMREGMQAMRGMGSMMGSMRGGEAGHGSDATDQDMAGSSGADAMCEGMMRDGMMKMHKMMMKRMSMMTEMMEQMMEHEAAEQQLERR